MIYRFKISMGSQMRGLYHLIIYLLMLGFIGYYYYFIKNWENLPLLIECLAGFFVIMAIPHILLHVNFFNINKKDEVIYDTDRKHIIFHSNSEKIEFDLSDIRLMEWHLSYPLGNKHKTLPLLTWDSYSFIKLLLKNGQIITITNLLMPNLTLPVDKDKILLKKGFYRWAKGPSLRIK